MDKKYDTAEDMFYAMLGCGCCSEINHNFDDLKARIIGEYKFEVKEETNRKFYELLIKMDEAYKNGVI